MKARRVRAAAAFVAGTFLVAACSSGSNGSSTPGSTGPSAGSGGSATTTASAGDGKVFNFRGANSTTADDAFGTSYTAFAKCLAAQSSNRIKLTMYQNATLGSDAEALELLQTGALDFTETTLTSTVLPDAAAFDLPYMFSTVEAWEKAVDGAPGDQIKQEALAKGMKILSFDEGGWREVYGNKDVKSISDFKGLKIRTLQTPVYVAFFKALGAVPSPLAFTEVYLALQQHTLDAAETALPSMFGAKQYEVSKYVIVTNHAMSTVPWVMSTKAWNSLPADLQSVVVACDKTRSEMQRTNQNESQKNMQQQLTAKGMTYVTIPLAPLQELAKSKVYPLATAPGEQALVAKIEAMN